MGEDQFCQETDAKTVNGWLALLIMSALLAFGAFFISGAIARGETSPLVTGAVLIVLGVFCTKGYFTLQPNEGAVMIFLGDYAGTVRISGFHWVNPLYQRRRLSLRAHNLATPILRVNDERGNPIEIGAVVVWRENETARAVFQVES
jgi:regulator of protease activity HflC (stomatin/prohibitin superfamily)